MGGLRGIPAFGNEKAAIHACLKEGLAAVYESLVPEPRIHPDQVEPESLVAGKDVILETSVLARVSDGPPKKIPPKLSVKFRGKTREKWEGRDEFFYEFFHPKTGTLKIPESTLRGHLFADIDFDLRGPYVSGELVQLDKVEQTTLFKTVVEKPSPHFGEAFPIDPPETPALVKFIGVYDRDHYLVEYVHQEFYWAGRKEPLRLAIPKANITALRFSTAKGFQKALAPLENFKMVFRKGEKVRYRDAQGLMKVGTYDHTVGDKIHVLDAQGKARVLPEKKVFKKGQGTPFTPRYPIPEKVQIGGTEVHSEPFMDEIPSGATLDLLDGAARITSHPEYQKLPPRAQLSLLLTYLKKTVGWDPAAQRFSQAQPNLGAMVCAGVGVCRHLALIMGQLVSESGFPNRLVNTYMEGVGGHAWIEVNTGKEILMVDPSFESANFVLPQEFIGEVVRQNPEVPMVRSYQSPHRAVYEDPQHPFDSELHR